jgi:hypothetical protein
MTERVSHVSGVSGPEILQKRLLLRARAFYDITSNA